MNWDETKKDRSGGCHFTPCPKNCLKCPFDDCRNSRPTVKGEMSVEMYVDMVDGVIPKEK